MTYRKISATLALLSFLAIGQPILGATLPSGFTELQVAAGLLSPTAMEFSPDGRLFVCQQGGRLRVIKNDTLLTKPFLTVTVDVNGERGLLGIAFDPNFASNNRVYVYYTSTSPTIHNRVSRFTASGDTALAGSEVILLDLPTLGATNHNGGAINFGIDGKLYIAVGENATPSNSQSLATPLGKMLRMNSDGTIPTDNPFYSTTTGINRLIWAYGLRNPFTFTMRPGTATMFINDVGQSAWEEIDYGIAGANYGWPATEGVSNNPSFVNPMFAYSHSGAADQSGCAITGGAFYNPGTLQFPASYTGKYFFADYCNGWIRLFNPPDSTVVAFASGISSPVDLKVSSGGSLYYLARGTGSATGMVFKVSASTGLAPSISLQPSDQLIPAGSPVIFSVNATGNAPLSFQWQRNSANIAGAMSQTYTIASVLVSDNGAMFRCVVTNAFGSATSNAARLTVTSNQPPTATIISPTNGTLYTAGDTVYFSGTGTDPQQGALGAGALTWTVDFQHLAHHHPVLPPTSGISSGSFVIPTVGETSDSVWFRIYLTVIDSGGLSNTDTAEIFPRKATVAIVTNPPGLQVRLDGTSYTSPLAFVGVVGMQREITAVTPQSKNGQLYVFSGWSDLGSADHFITTPVVNTTYTANFNFSPPAPLLVIPSNNAANQPADITFRWNTSSGASTYRFQLASDSLFAVLSVDDSTLTDTSRSVTGLAPATSFFWRVLAKNSVASSSWSSFRKFSTLNNSVSFSDLLIYQNALLSPWANTAWGGTFTYNSTEQSLSASNSIKCVTGSSGALRVRSSGWGSVVLIDPRLYSRVEFAIYNTTPGLSLNVSLSNEANGLFTVALYTTMPLNQWVTVSYPVSQLDPANLPIQFFTLQSNTTPSKTFYIDNIRFISVVTASVPTAPTLASPVDGATNQPTSSTFRWNPSPGASNYRFQLATDSLFVATIVDDSTLTDTARSVASLSNSTKYFWRVNARNGMGTSSYSATRKLTIAPFILAAPVLLTPSNNAANQPVAITFRWNSSPGASTYRFQLASDSVFAVVTVDDSTLTDTSRSTGGLVSAASYFWRVLAKNSLATSVWTSFRKFSTLDTIAPTVAITSPGGAGNIASPVSISGTFTVTASAADNLAVAGVQFRLDGAILGAEDTSPPYSIAWNTLSSSNGDHTLTAVARDAAGNITTSASVVVTVSNTVSSSDLLIYQNALLSPWANTAWGGTFTYNSAEQSLSASNSIKCVTGSSGALRVRSSGWGSVVPIDPHLYSRVEFAIYNTTPGLSLTVSLSNEANGLFAQVVYTTMPTNQWVTVSYPVSQLDPTNLPIQFFTLQSNTTASRTFYIDNIRFVAVTPPAPAMLAANFGESNAAIPDQFKLEEGFPNPFNPSTTATFDLPVAANVSLKVYDVLGREVSTLANELLQAGRYQKTWNPGEVAGGMYFVRLQVVGGTGELLFVQTRKVLFVK